MLVTIRAEFGGRHVQLNFFRRLIFNLVTYDTITLRREGKPLPKNEILENSHEDTTLANSVVGKNRYLYTKIRAAF